ncbi:MAG: TetR/AcrR family transcriptional regulator [Spirochaetota bacterium]
MPESPVADGRRTRQLENKAKVIRAMLDLLRETGEVPSVEDVADRAHVSRRSVFRFFANRELLLRATIDLMSAEVRERFPMPEPSGGPIADRIARFVEHRADYYEFITPVRRIAERKKDVAAPIREAQARARTAEREHIAAYFADLGPRPGNDRERWIDAVWLVASWNAWAALRLDYGRSVGQAREVVERSLRAIVAGHGGGEEP